MSVQVKLEQWWVKQKVLEGKRKCLFQLCLRWESVDPSQLLHLPVVRRLFDYCTVHDVTSEISDNNSIHLVLLSQVVCLQKCFEMLRNGFISVRVHHQSRNPGGSEEGSAWTGRGFKSIHTCQQPCQGFCRRWSAVCHWSTACWWGTSWSVCSKDLLSPEDWPAAPGECGGIFAWTYIRTGLSNSWLCTAWGR